MPDQISPELHELAYSYRDYEAEVTFVEYCWQQYTQAASNRVLDIGCGTGEHMRQFLLRGYDCDGFDIDEDMLSFARAKFEAGNLSASVWQADMRSFDVEKKYGLAINLLASINKLLTNEEIISHLRSVAGALEEGGIFLLEMFHPREYGFPPDSPASAWEIYNEEVNLECVLHFERQPLDPISQSQETTMRITVSRDDENKIHDFRRTQRVYLYHEFRALIQAAGGFEMAACFGAFNTECPLDNSKRSWRMIPVLRRT